MITFIQAKRAILTELHTIIVSTSPDVASQQCAVQTLTGLLAAGVAPSAIAILFVDAPANAIVDEAYPLVVGCAREVEIQIAPEAMLPASIPFSKAQQFKMPIARIVNGVDNYEVELTRAHLDGANEKILFALSHKVIAQRELLAATQTFKRVAKALGLPCISTDEWRADATPTMNRKRMKTAAID